MNEYFSNIEYTLFELKSPIKNHLHAALTKTCYIYTTTSVPSMCHNEYKIYINHLLSLLDLAH